MRFLACALAAAGTLLAQPVTVIDLLEQKTAARIRQLDESLDGVLGVAAIDLKNGTTFSYHGEAVFPQASSIKVPLLLQVYRAAREGKIGLDSEVVLNPADSVGGSGNLQNALKNGPVKTTVRGLVRAMIEDSDNTATNKLIAMTGMTAVNEMLDGMGFKLTRLRRVMMDGDAAERDDENVSTPLEMAGIFEAIYRGKAAGEQATGEILGVLKLVKADIRKAVPPKIEVAAKPGDLDGVNCETGIVYLPGRPFIASIMSTYLGGRNPVPEVAKILYSHFEKLADSNRYGHRLRQP